jgi:hypothetical protein
MGVRTEKEQEVKCVTCGDEILPERAVLGFTYCTKAKCVRENRQGLTVIEISQHKTNPEYVILDSERGGRALNDMREGKYRRDPVVVKRQPARTDVAVAKGRFRKPKIERHDPNRVKFVQALRDQGYRVEEILAKGAYMNLTRSEVVRYMSGRMRG